MTTPVKTAANRQNALQSTGPRTLEGQAIAAKNALKHGLLSQEVLLPSENAEMLAELVQRVREDLQPVGELETILVDRVVAAFWRLRRLRIVETGIFSWYLYEGQAARAEGDARSYEDDSLQAFLKMEITITDEEKRKEALAKANEARQRQAESCTFGSAFIRDASGADVFSKLSRY